MKNGTTSKYAGSFLYFFYIIFFISIVCSFRAISTIAIILILATSLLKNKSDTGSLFNKKLKNIFFAACCLFYLVQACSVFYTNNLDEMVKHLQLKSSLVLIPAALCCSDWLNPLSRKTLMNHYTWIVAAAMLYCFGIAIWKYFSLHSGNEVFFYHELVSPFKQHAIQVSILVFIAVVHLLQRKGPYLQNNFIHYLLILYFIFCIVMLASKMVISFLAVYLAYYLVTSFYRKEISAAVTFTAIASCIIVATLIIFTQNPVSKRFNEIISGNVELAYRENFAPDIYFNGVQFRLLEWKFVSQILTGKNAWLTGVSTGDAQKLLDDKYISTHMYLGEPGSNDHGFLGYDTHNEFLQSTLQSGIPGLMAFILTCYGLIHLAVKRKSQELSAVVILLIAYSFMESCFEGQYGLILFTFFPLFIYYGSDKKDLSK